MIASLATLAALTTQQAAPPQDWTALPSFPMPRASLSEGSEFVRSEIAAGRCRLAGQSATTKVVVPVAILVGPSGMASRIVPQAIGCPTVEQYTVGYLFSLTRAGPVSAVPPAPGWYRLAVTYNW